MAAILLLTENFACSNFYKLQCYAVCLASTDIQTGEPEMELWFAVALPAGWKLVLLYIFTIIETTLTPLLCPFIAYVFYMDQISNSKRTEEEKEKGKTEKPLRGLYVLYTVVSKEESHSRVLMILIVGMNLSVVLRL